VNLDNLRILHVSTWKIPCGIATYCDNLVKALDAEGTRNTVAPVHPAEWKYCLPVDIARWQQSIVQQARDVDLVHIQHEHGLFGYGVGSKFAVKRFGGLLTALQEIAKPVVTTFHTDICTHSRRGLRGKWDRFRRKYLWSRHVTHHFGSESGRARAIVHSSATRRSFVRHGFPVNSIQVIPHACLAPRNYTLSNEEAKAALGLPANSKLLSLFGFISQYKGHDLAMAALERLPENFHLAMVGGMHPEAKDDFLDKLLASIPASMAHRIHVTGWVDRDTADTFFAATDVCLAPYRGKTLLSGSGAITWGLSSGRPVIASKIEAFQNVDRIGNCLFLVTPEKTSELAWAVQKLVNDASLRERLVANANRFSESHSWAQSVSELAKVYGAVLGKSDGNAGLSVFPQSHAA